MSSLFDKTEMSSKAILKLSKHLDGRLKSLRLSNDNSLSERDTALTRGRIAEIKLLLEEMES